MVRLQDYFYDTENTACRKNVESMESLLLKRQASNNLKESLMESNLFDVEVIDNIVAVFESVTDDYVFGKKKQ